VRPEHTVRIGVVGCGAIAYWSHLRVVRRLPGAVLVAIAEPDPAARARAERLTRLTAHADPAELLGRGDVDAVVVSAPTHLHASLALDCCAAGKHLYLEKPLATSIEDARRCVAAAADAGVVGMIGFNRRYHPAVAQARDALRSDRIGMVRAVLSAFAEPADPSEMPPWKRARSSGGGALLDLASHHVDLVRHLLETEIDHVEARVGSERTEDDTAWLRLTTTDGAGVAGFYSFRAARTDTFELIGERGTLRVDRLAGRASLRLTRRRRYGVSRGILRPRRETVLSPRAGLVRRYRDPSYAAALAAFVGAIRGDTREVPTLADGLRALEPLLAAEESSRRGHPVTIVRDP
jgi:myo-inositol 2-dehydrogenase/D-chiro-inositol 1-dehydrogenase